MPTSIDSQCAQAMARVQAGIEESAFRHALELRQGFHLAIARARYRHVIQDELTKIMRSDEFKSLLGHGLFGQAATK